MEEQSSWKTNKSSSATTKIKQKGKKDEKSSKSPVSKYVRQKPCTNSKVVTSKVTEKETYASVLMKERKNCETTPAGGNETERKTTDPALNKPGKASRVPSKVKEYKSSKQSGVGKISSKSFAIANHTCAEKVEKIKGGYARSTTIKTSSTTVTRTDTKVETKVNCNVFGVNPNQIETSKDQYKFSTSKTPSYIHEDGLNVSNQSHPAKINRTTASSAQSLEDPGRNTVKNTCSATTNPAKIKESPTSSTQQHTSVNIGPRNKIADYVKTEWKGGTHRAGIIRKGYEDIVCSHGFTQIRRIRGDNYCAIRATLFQMLRAALDLESHVGSVNDIFQPIETHGDSCYGCLQKWTFANRFDHDKSSILGTVKRCIRDLYMQFRTSQYLMPEDRENHFAAALNSDPSLDVRLHEAIKFLMMVKAIQYYKQYQEGNDVPTFVWLLFARDTSETPGKLLCNHISKIGDTGGMEMVEMCLLSYTLGVRIVVARPSQQGKEDFMTTFPDEGGEHFAPVYLVAEDDRHYNVLLS